jgi:hypothetical protein
MKNPALRQEPRYEPAPVIPLKHEIPLLEWLKENNRILFREQKLDLPSPIEENDEIDEIIEEDDVDSFADDSDYSADDDDIEDTENY